MINDVRIIAINPGSTTTKIAVFDGENPLFQKTIFHSKSDLKPFKKITDQFEFRKGVILSELKKGGISLDNVQIIMGRGGLLKPIPSGVYEVNDTMIRDLLSDKLGEHASNLGGLIAHNLAESIPGAKAYIVDPIVVDELSDLARIAGHPLFERTSIFHALNQKAIAREYAKSIHCRYEDLNLLVVHLGGGITVGAHLKGQVVDVNQGLNGEGPFTPERGMTLPSNQLVKICFSGKYTEQQVMKMVSGESGLVAYLGTNSAKEVSKRVSEGDAKAKLIYDAMAYQTAKEVGAMAAVLNCEVDAILITGGIAHDEYFVNKIKERVCRLAPVFVYPGEDEMRAMAMNGLMLFNKELEPKVYC
ncbi:MAG: butyrate kinase [Bacteroidota bacterium]|nr:butyrate kinase [Bacteroidota bacterium]